jgi:hypothetical protein
MGDIKLVDSLLKDPIEQFFNLHKTDGVKDYIDTSMISYSDLSGILTDIHIIDSTYGKVADYKLKGFGFSSLERNNVAVVILLIDVFNGNVVTHYKFFVKPRIKKIGYIEINGSDYSHVGSL